MNGMHLESNIVWKGKPISEASRAMILLHGRGSSPGNILSLTQYFDAKDMAIAAPAATHHTWYPTSFLAPESENQPWLDSALALVQGTLQQMEDRGIPAEKIYLLGFSQGACLALESVARRPKRYGGVVALSGGLIGLGVNQRAFPGSLQGTPVFMGCSDVDPHIPKARFQESAQVLKGMGADVRDVLYPNMGHTVNEDEIDQVNLILNGE
jgi:predicted esterase